MVLVYPLGFLLQHFHRQSWSIHILVLVGENNQALVLYLIAMCLVFPRYPYSLFILSKCPILGANLNLDIDMTCATISYLPRVMAHRSCPIMHMYSVICSSLHRLVLSGHSFLEVI